MSISLLSVLWLTFESLGCTVQVALRVVLIWKWWFYLMIFSCFTLGSFESNERVCMRTELSEYSRPGGFKHICHHYLCIVSSSKQRIPFSHVPAGFPVSTFILRWKESNLIFCLRSTYCYCSALIVLFTSSFLLICSYKISHKCLIPNNRVPE